MANSGAKKPNQYTVLFKRIKELTACHTMAKECNSFSLKQTKPNNQNTLLYIIYKTTRKRDRQAGPSLS